MISRGGGDCLLEFLPQGLGSFEADMETYGAWMDAERVR